MIPFLVFGTIGIILTIGITLVIRLTGEEGTHASRPARTPPRAAGTPGAARRVTIRARRAARTARTWLRSELDGLADWPQDIETTMRIFEEMCAEDTGGLRALHDGHLPAPTLHQALHNELPVAGMVAGEIPARAEDTPVETPAAGPGLEPGAGFETGPVTTATCSAADIPVKVDSPAPGTEAPTRGDAQGRAVRACATEPRPAARADLTGSLSPRPHQERPGPVSAPPDPGTHELPVAGMVATENVARAEGTPVKHPLPGPVMGPGAGVSLSPVTTATCPADATPVKVDSPVPADVCGAPAPAPVSVSRQDLDAEAAATRPWADDTGAFTAICADVMGAAR